MTEEKLFELWKKANEQFTKIKDKQSAYNDGIERGMDLMYEEVKRAITEVQEDET